MDLFSYANKSLDEIFEEFKVTRNGLSINSVIKLQEICGLNKIEYSKVYWWHILLRQFKSPFIYLLIVASLVSFGLKDVLNGLMILLFVLIDVFLGFYQEYKSEKILKYLKKYITSLSKIIRDGVKNTVKSEELVPGDIVFLEAGDLVPCDIRVIEEENLTVDESVLTGESVFIKKQSSPLKKVVDEFYEANNLCFSGTTLATGKCTGIVLKTGKETALGKIAKLSIETHRESDFEKSITSLSSFILRLTLITLAIIFILNLILKGQSANFPQLLIFSIALVVSVIPEALPAVMTFSLSKGAFKLAKNNVVIKRLSAIEDLGSVEILCADKTGTLTENKLSVSNIYAVKEKEEVLMFSGLKIEGFEDAVFKKLSSAYKRNIEVLDNLPFDPERKRSALLVKGKLFPTVYVRGACEEIVKLCSHLTYSEKKSISVWAEEEGLKGGRVIAIAKKKLEKGEDFAGSAESNLNFIGLVSFFDPIKKTANSTIKRAQNLGVGVKILTGDSKEVSFAVAKEIGLVEKITDITTGAEFNKLSNLEKTQAVLRYNVFSRVTPEQKFEIINLLQSKFVVGFLGEGINDAPALKIANVGLVVKGAANVANEAADIVLLKKDLGVIIGGIQAGRETFANTTKYIKATLASNFGNFYTVAIVSLFIDFLPLLPLQILLLNLLSDFPMVAIATDSVDKEELKSPKKYNIKDIALVGSFLGIVSSFFDFMFFLVFYKISPAVLQTNWFMGSVITELLFLFSIRTKRGIFKATKPSKSILVLTVFTIIITLILPFTVLGHKLFSFESPKPSYLVTMGIIVVCYLAVTEIVKRLYYKKFDKNQ
ncbi:MAG: HAD-IC family P-type ATPase [Patescibacteria group bacterium]